MKKENGARVFPNSTVNRQETDDQIIITHSVWNIPPINQQDEFETGLFIIPSVLFYPL